MEQQFIVCDCGHIEHLIVLSFDPDESEPEYREIYLEVFLNPHRHFLVRVWHAIKYIFGYRSKYGDFDEVVLGKSQVAKLMDFLIKFERTAAPEKSVVKGS